MKYALTTFALIVTLLGGFIFGAYYMYRKNNPAEPVVEQVNEEPSEEDVLDTSQYYDSDGNWIFRYNENENWDGGDGNTVLLREDAAENIDYRITGTNFVYEDDGLFSGFHAVVTIENVGQSNLYLGRGSVFNIEDRNLDVVDSYDFVRAVPDVIAPGEKGFFYVPYGHIKTREDSVTIEEDDLTGGSPNPGEASSAETPTNGEDINAIDIDELEKALMEEGLTTSSLTITKDAEIRMASADEAETSSVEENGKKSGGTELLPADESDAGSSSSKGKANAKDNVPVEDVKEASASEGSSDEASEDKDNSAAEKSGDKSENSDDKASDESKSSDDGKSEDASDTEKSDASSDEEKESENEDEEAGESEDSSEDASSNSASSATKPEKVEYAGLSLYRVNEYFIMPDLDVKKCVGDPRKDFDIANIMYGSNASGYFTLSADVTNSTDENVDYVPVTVIALDRRGNAIAAGADSITDFYKGATKSFGVSYILTREQRSNIVQCVIYAREVVNKK